MHLATVIDPHPAERPALISRGKVTTYGELRDQVGRLRGALTARGIGPGDRVAVVAANNWYFVVAYLAVLGVGAIAVPLNPQSPRPEPEADLATVGARLALVGPAAHDTIGTLAQDGRAGDDFQGSALVSDLLDAAGDPTPGVETADTDPAVLLFTSGTAGAPRPAVLTHGNLEANID